MRFWKLGRIFTTLRYLIEKDLRETIYENTAYKDNRWGLIELQVLTWSKNPLTYAAALGIAFTLLAIAFVCLKPYIRSFIPGSYPEWQGLIQWQSTFLTVQITVIAVVFPLVIGLIGILLQSKTASKAIWSVYNHYSGFLFTGFSGVLLSVFIVLGKYLEPVVDPIWYLSISGQVSMWLIFNLALTGWFLCATFKVIHESSRDALLLKYTVNESFIDDIRKRMSELLPQVAGDRGLIYKRDKEGLELSTVLFSREDESYFTITHSKPAYIQNVRFRFLSLASFLVFWWNRHFSSDKEIRIVFPATADNMERRKYDLAAIKGSDFNALEKIIVRISYSFSTKKPFPDDVLKDIIFSLVGSSFDELKNNNPKLFEESIRKLAHWHSMVSDVLVFIDDNGQVDNWLLMPSSGFFGRTYLDELSREYYLLAERAVEKIPSSTEFFEDISHLHIKLYNWPKEKQPIKIVERLIYGNYLCWVALNDWSAVNEDFKGTAVYHQYENAILTYIGAWETWPMYLEPRSSRWQESIAMIPAFMKHLSCTSQQVIVAVKRGDELAAEWAVDMLSHWLGNASLRGYGHHHYIWYHELVVHSIMDRKSDDSLWKFILNNNEYDGPSATQIAMENAWTDVRLLTACYLLSKPNTQEDDVVDKLLSALIDGRKLKAPSSSGHSVRGFNSGADILAAYIRQRWYWEYSDNNYGSWLNSIVDSFNRIDEPKRVSGRVYSSWGADDVRSLNKSYVILATMKSTKEWVIGQRWLDLLFSEAVSQNDRDNLIRDLEGWLSIASDGVEEDHELDKQNVANFKSSVEKVISEISERNDQEIRDADIDEQLLIKFGSYASKSAFNVDTGSTMLSFFDEVTLDNGLTEDSQHKLNILGYDKSHVAAGVDVNRAVNEDSWLDDMMLQNVSYKLYGALCEIDNTIKLEFESNVSLLKRVATDIDQMKKVGEDPLFFVNPWGIHRLLNDLVYDDSMSSDFNIEIKNGYGNSYICHIEGVPAYQMPFRKDNYCILAARRMFKNVRFKEYAEGRYVDVTWKDYDEKSLKLTLVLRYLMKIELGDCPSYRYVSLDKSEN